MGDASKHAPLPPSSAHRWMRCAYSVHGTPVASPDSEHSRLGTFAHEIAASALLGERDPRDLIGRRSDTGEFQVDHVMADHLRVYQNEVLAAQLETGAELTVEQPVTLVPGLVYGTADALLVDDSRLLVVDLKYGAGVLVDAEDNEQLLIYAAAALQDHPQVRRVGCMIVQPRRPDADDRVVRWAEYSADAVRAFAETVKARAQEIQDGAADAVPGDHCRWCPKAATCKALASAANAVAADVFKAVTPPEPEQLKPDEIARILTGAKRFEEWVDAVRAYAEDAAKAGTIQIPGYKLVETLSNRRWTDEDTAVTTLKNAGVDPWVRAVISPAEAERRLGKSKIKLLPATTREVNGAKLVPASDKRPAITNAAEVFRNNKLDS